jgi:hypothetical protein
VILRDNQDAGLHVTASGNAEVMNVTAAHNGAGLRAAGPIHVRNTLVISNVIGVEAVFAGVVDSRYNDVFGNRTEDWRNVRPGSHDLAQPVAFEAATPEDADRGLRLAPAQPSTDKGDPTDDFAAEPAPNGGRINIGAFGNTRFAELSASGSLPPGATPPGPGVTDPPPSNDPVPVGPRNGRGGLCSLASPDDDRRPDGALVLVLLALFGTRRWTGPAGRH